MWEWLRGHVVDVFGVQRDDTSDRPQARSECHAPNKSLLRRNISPPEFVSIPMPVWKQRTLCLVTWFVFSMAFAS